MSSARDADQLAAPRHLAEHDVTERDRHSGAVHQLASIVEAADDAIIGVELDGTIFSWNCAAEQMYGYAAADAVGQTVWLIVPAAKRDEMRAWLGAVRSGRRISYRETVRVARNGCPVDVAESISPLRDGAGAVVAASVVDRDTTERRWMASTLDATLDELQSALAKARESEARSRRFLADAAHQLRTPITGIRMCAQNLLQGGGSHQERLVADLVRETARVSGLVTSLLRAARLDDGEPVVPVPTDLVRLCAGEVDRASRLAPHLDFDLSAEGLGDGRLTLDARLVREVLANLIDNARRHAAERVKVVVHDAGGGVEVVVWDDGPGVPAGMEEKIFERFVSIGDPGGSGLGLAIARQLARAHGGELSYGRRGFALWLPLSPVADHGPT